MLVIVFINSLTNHVAVKNMYFFPSERNVSSRVEGEKFKYIEK